MEEVTEESTTEEAMTEEAMEVATMEEAVMEVVAMEEAAMLVAEGTEVEAINFTIIEPFIEIPFSCIIRNFVSLSIKISFKIFSSIFLG